MSKTDKIERPSKGGRYYRVAGKLLTAEEYHKQAQKKAKASSAKSGKK